MRALGKLLSVQGNRVTLALDEEINIERLSRWSDGKQLGVGVEFDDGRKRSIEQLRKAYALMADFSESTGYPPDDVKQIMKDEYLLTYDQEMPSQATASMDVESKFINVIIDTCFRECIPFRTQTWDLIKNDYRAVYQATIHRYCVVCGKPHADIDHVSHTVGMGRNRRTTDPTQFLYWALCRECHTRRHAMGIKSFCKLYQLKPVKLAPNDLVRLGLITKQVARQYQQN